MWFIKSSKPVSDITAVIRSVGERTEALCHCLLSRQIPEKNIIVVRETPFSAALTKSFKIALERDLPWTLCIDADVLIRDGIIGRMVSIAKRAAGNVFEIHGGILDKFFGGLKPSGIHLYRSALLEKALDHIPSTEEHVIRPETHTKQQMAAKGFPSLEKKIVVGLHDYEQYYKDIYRKILFHSRKHERFIPYLKPYWQRMADVDADFQVALWGIKAGEIFSGSLDADVRLFPEEIGNRLKTISLEEKKKLADTAFSSEQIGEIIKKFKPPAEYRRCVFLIYKK